jgi:hypothetical protein
MQPPSLQKAEVQWSNNSEYAGFWQQYWHPFGTAHGGW